MMGRALWYFAQSMREYTLSRDDLESIQTKRLRRTLTMAYDRIPYYHDLMRKLGRTPAEVSRVEDLQRFPLMTKEDVVENERRLIPQSPPTYVKEGSGTSGKTMRIFYDQNYVDHAIAFQLRKYVEFGVRPWEKMVTIWPPRRYWRRALFGKRKGEPTTWADEMGLMSALAKLSTRASYLQASEDDPQRDLEELVKLGPRFALGRPSHLLRMAEYLPAKGAGIALRGLEARHEAFTDHSKKKIEDAFGGKVLQGYGSNETGSGGAECRFQRGIHLNEDWLLYEVLKDGERVGPGERGELVVTVLLNDSMPLVRYATGDTVEMADGGRCDCGSWLMRVRKTLGRMDDWLQTAQGTLVQPLEVAEEVEAKLGMKQYQIVQKKVSEFEVKTRNPVVDRMRLAGPLGAYLAGLAGTPVNLSFVRLPPEDNWLKSRPVTCAIP